MSGYAERATTRRRQAGFTLIEVMVAIMLMAIVSLMAWRGLDSIARASAHLEDSTEQGAALLRALNQLERDIALHSAIREESGLPSGDEPIRAGDSLPPRTRTEAPERDPIAPGHRPRQYRARRAAAARALVATGQGPLPRRLAQRRPPAVAAAGGAGGCAGRRESVRDPCLGAGKGLDAPAGTQQSPRQRTGDQPGAGHPQRRGALSTGGGPAMKRWLSRAAPPRPAGG